MMRVYEIAKEVGIPNKELLAKIRSLGLEVNNHMSSLDADAVARIKKSLERERTGGAAPAETQKLSTTSGAVIRRRSAKADEAEGTAPHAATPVSTAAASSPSIAPPLVRRRTVDAPPVSAPSP
ncbi:MAG TPA: translation initiation factor IF-2 N-terminal domain-containing protein, partial [Kofleriaceae bacterium]|nr:translation initiation factor IF-2 N-terminal domain-containing protein [Kofleriaceae bacterium]